MDCASLPPSPPSPGLARGWREGGGLLVLDCNSPPPSSPSPGGPSRPILHPAGPCGWQAPPFRRTDFLDDSTTDIDCFTSRATRPTVLPAAKRNGKVREKHAHIGGLSRLCRCAQPAPAAGRRVLHHAGLRPASGLGRMSGGGAWGTRCLHLHPRRHSAGFRPAPGLGWASGGGAWGTRRLHLHHRLHCASLRPAPGLGWLSGGDV